MEHAVQPHQGDQHQLGEKESGDHGTTPSDKCSNEGIVPGFQTTGISRRLEVHDQRRGSCKPGARHPAGPTGAGGEHLIHGYLLKAGQLGVGQVR